MAKILNGKAVAAEVRSEVAAGVARLKDRGVPVRLDVILVGDDPASATYVRMKQKDCDEVGIESRAHRFEADTSQRELAALVERLNADPAVSGFFIQLPLPEGLDPLSLRENATVTVCHSRTKNLPEVARRAELLVIAAGRREFVGAECVREGAVVVDVGIHAREGGGLIGDVRFDEVEPVASYISPVPGGVGPMTRAMLLYNTVQAARAVG